MNRPSSVISEQTPSVTAPVVAEVTPAPEAKQASPIFDGYVLDVLARIEKFCRLRTSFQADPHAADVLALLALSVKLKEAYEQTHMAESSFRSDVDRLWIKCRPHLGAVLCWPLRPLEAGQISQCYILGSPCSGASTLFRTLFADLPPSATVTTLIGTVHRAMGRWSMKLTDSQKARMSPACLKSVRKANCGSYSFFPGQDDAYVFTANDAVTIWQDATFQQEFQCSATSSCFPQGLAHQLGNLFPRLLSTEGKLHDFVFQEVDVLSQYEFSPMPTTVKKEVFLGGRTVAG
jgi:hypothetical protein